MKLLAHRAAKTADRRGEGQGDDAVMRAAAPKSRVLSAAALRAHTKSTAASAFAVASPALARSTTAGSTRQSSRPLASATLKSSSSRVSSAKPAVKADSTRASTRVADASPEGSRTNRPRSGATETKKGSLAGRALSAERSRTKSSSSISASAKPVQHQEAWPELSLPQDAAIVARVKRKLVARCGENGLNSLQLVLQAMASPGGGVLSPNEFKFGLRDLGVELSASELSQVVEVIDRNRDGTIELDELLHALRGHQLAGTRLALVRQAFALMDPGGEGVVSVDDIRNNYDVSSLPAVRAKKKSKQQALAEFLQYWEESSDYNNSADIPFDAFLDYYQNVSACVTEDSAFELLMRQTWHVSPPEQREHDDKAGGGDLEQEKHDPNSGARLPLWTEDSHLQDTTNRRERVPIRDNNEEGGEELLVSEPSQLERDWRYLQKLIVPTAGAHPTSKVPTVDDISRKLGANRVWGDGNEVLQAKVFARALALLDRQLPAKEALLLAQRVASSVSANARHRSGASIELVELHRWLLRSHFEESVHTANGDATNIRNINTQPSTVVSRVRNRLLQRIARSSSESIAATSDVFNVSHVGLNGLQRCLKLLDTSGDKRLTKDELKLGLRKFGVDVTFYELDYLFSYFDSDRSGCIGVDEFLVGMRGEMSARRASLVDMAFDLLDKNSDGAVTLDELAAAYDTSQHPDVVSGRVTAEDALRAFAAQWENETERDGVVTKREFETYYTNLSASIDSDDYFELMMRNAWHISGGEGVCANSTNRRVLVTRADQSQSVEEIKNDLGVRTGDRDKMRTMVVKQGVAVACGSAIGTSGVCANQRQAASNGGGAGRPPVSRLDKPPGQKKTSTTRSFISATPKDRSTGIAPGRTFHRCRVLEMAEEDNFESSGVGILPGRRQLGMRNGSKPSAARANDSDAFPAMSHIQRLEAERGARQQAAQLIQRHFRGFKARRFVECVKRKLAVEHQRLQREQAEQKSGRKKVLRAALRTYHGF